MPIRLNDFEMPKRVVKEESSATKTFARYTAEPFEIGYARTIGNSLRRVLLSSVEGFAISSVKIEGAPHEFCTLPGVREDVTEIILSLKKVLIASEIKEAKFIHISKKGPCEVTAKDFEDACSGITVLNPKHHIATVNENGVFEADFKVTRGRGFCPASWEVDPGAPDNRPRQKVIGEIPVDRIYSPVTRVNFLVEDCRVGQRTDYEKLVLEVSTDGRVTPDDALVHAAAILRQHLDVFVDVNKDLIEDEVEETPAESGDNDDLKSKFAMKVSEIELGVRSANCLNAAKITTVGQLCRMSRGDLLRFRNFGQRSLTEIEEKLKSIGLGLGMKIDPSLLPDDDPGMPEIPEE